jgi:nitroimidazol reductase NimA-like FMN-containing flavoprotein (pyridoxamine 5'-phosphate oxidase superfamily)
METDARNGMEILDQDTCWDLLASAPVGRLAISIQNHPDIFPVNHVVDDREVVFRTAEGTKLAAALLGASVAYEVDGYDPAAGEAWSVVVKGRAEELDRLLDVLHAEDLPLYPWNASYKPRFVRIVPDEVTGRRFHVVPGALIHD